MPRLTSFNLCHKIYFRLDFFDVVAFVSRATEFVKRSNSRIDYNTIEIPHSQKEKRCIGTLKKGIIWIKNAVDAAAIVIHQQNRGISFKRTNIFQWPLDILFLIRIVKIDFCSQFVRHAFLFPYSYNYQNKLELHGSMGIRFEIPICNEWIKTIQIKMVTRQRPWKIFIKY